MRRDLFKCAAAVGAGFTSLHIPDGFFFFVFFSASGLFVAHVLLRGPGCVAAHMFLFSVGVLAVSASIAARMRVGERVGQFAPPPHPRQKAQPSWILDVLLNSSLPNVGSFFFHFDTLSFPSLAG